MRVEASERARDQLQWKLEKSGTSGQESETAFQKHNSQSQEE